MKRLITSIILLAITSFAQAQDNSPVSAEDMGKLPYISSITLSPDGTKIASFRNIQGRKALFIQKISELGDTKPNIVFYEDGELNWFHWLNNERLAISIRFGGKRLGTETTERRLIAMNWDKSNMLNLVKRQRQKRKTVGQSHA